MNLSDSQGSQMLLYNIGFFVNGKEVTPKTPVTLKVQFLDENGEPLNGPVKVIHFAEEGTEIVEDASTDSNGVTSFLTSNESESENSSEQDNADGAGNVAQN